MELIEIADEKGNFTGTIIDKDEAHNSNLFYWAVGIFLINNKKQVLLQKRGANKKIKPNMWAMCAGHVKANEEIEIAAIRELNEEIGLNVSINDLHLLESMEVQKMDKNSHLTRFYYVLCNKNESIVFKDDRIHLFEKLKEINNI